MYVIKISFLFFWVAMLSSCSASEPPKPIYSKVLPSQISDLVNRIHSHEVSYQKMGNRMRYCMQRTEHNGQSVYLLEVFFNPQPESVPDKIYLNPNTLAFVERDLVLDAYSINVTYQDGLFSGKLTPAENSDYQEVIYHKRYPHGAFEPAVINYAISMLPLEVGYQASIPVFDLNAGSQLLWSNIEVVNRETIRIEGKEFDTWKVRSRGIRNKTIWVSVDQPFAIKMETEGNLGSWLIDPDSIKLVR